MTTEAVSQDILDRAARGARELDAVRPGWENEIDLDKLDIAVSLCCIAGQLVGAYGKYKRLGLEGESVENGMCSSNPENSNEEYPALTQAWRGEIQKRRPAHATRARTRTF